MGSYWFSKPAEENPSSFVSEEVDGYRLLGCSRNLAYLIHVTHGITINSEVFCLTLKKLKSAIQNKRRGLLSSGVVHLHDNAPSHCCKNTRGLAQIQMECVSKSSLRPGLGYF
ncbi:uncharacterized protein TNCT_264641 [Trichonephila clavata]|uniref:Transposase n=1 Tax=Trichonephila clavata TaxID=2740835 RepID=A0A8X6F2I8_TRICU|nr:uncharacterized protein TNCT_264641 [Trichonephila clavata]